MSGDFNAHSPLWSSDCLTPDREGRNIEAALLSIDLVCLNDGSATWSASDGSSRSALDLTLTSGNLSSGFWYAETSSFGSDHFPILTTWDNIHCQNNPCRPLFSVHKVDWTRFASVLENTISPTAAFMEDIESAYNHLTKCMEDAVISAGGKLKTSNSLSKKSPTIWWNQECTDLIRGKKEAYLNFCRNPSLDNFNIHSQATKDTKRRLRKIRSESFRDFCSSINPSMRIDKMWSIIRGFKSKYNKDHNYSIDYSGQMDTVMETFSRVASPLNEEELNDFSWESLGVSQTRADIIRRGYTRTPSRNQLLTPFSRQELGAAISSLKIKSASGPDLISNRMIRNLPSIGRTFLLRIFNRIFSHGTIPKSWKSFHMTFIPKPCSNSFRPISVANCLLKLFEKILFYRMEWWLERLDCIPQTQFGFRKARSCSDNLSILHNDITSGFTENAHTGAIFLDIKGAFDNVVPSTLLCILEVLGVPSKITNILGKIITNREVEGFLGGRSIGRRTAGRGLPQGLTLSPILYNVYSAFIPMCLPEDARILMYADDICIYSINSNLPSTINTLNTALDKISTALACLNLSIAPQKTQFCIFSRLRPQNINRSLARDNLHLVLNTVENGPILIPPKSHAKFLGLILDNNLTWSQHTDYVKKKTLPRLNILKAISGISWGAHPDNLLTVYKGLIRPILDWDCMALYNIDPKLMIKLDRIQYAALRTSLGLFISTPTNVILHLSGELPLSIRWKVLTNRHLIKICAASEHPLLSRLQSSSGAEAASSFLLQRLRSWKEETSELLCRQGRPGSLNFDYGVRFFLPLINTEMGQNLKIFKTASNIHTEHNYAIHPNDPSPPAEVHFQREIGPLGFHTIIYTDGFKQDSGETGYAVYCPSPQFSTKVKINPLNSIFEAEAMAILEAILIIEQRDFKSVMIATDSYSVLSGLGSQDTKGLKHPLLYLIKDSLLKLTAQNFNITLTWIPSHLGILGNEVVDALANEAAKSLPESQIKIINRTFTRNYFKSIKDRALEESSTFFRTSALEKGYRYFNRARTKPGTPWFRPLNLCRNTIRIISRIRSFHMHTKAHLTDKNFIDNPSCTCGAALQDLDHLFFNCPQLNSHSAKLILALHRAGINPNDTITDVAFSDNTKAFRALRRFVLDSKIIL